MSKFYKTIKHHGTALAFIAGFVWDNIMLSRIDHWFANAMLGTYLGLSAVCILAMNMTPVSGWRGRLAEKSSTWLPLISTSKERVENSDFTQRPSAVESKGTTPPQRGGVVPFILQFCFGSLFSAYLVLYTRSASLSSDWPFLGFLIFLVISNELFRRRYLSITLPGSVFFIVLFSWSIFSLPVLVNSMDDTIFILSGIVTVAAFLLFSFLLYRVAPERFKASRKSLFGSVLGLYILFNLAYFGGFIPPVPLALKEIGAYHSVTRTTAGNYKLSFEPSRWYRFLGGTASVFHRNSGEPVYIWSAVFAPTELTTPIFHRWQYFNEAENEWVTTDLLQFSIVGGRDQGFRGYSVKTNVFPARWRVLVETFRQDLIGLVEFAIESTTTPLANLALEER